MILRSLETCIQYKQYQKSGNKDDDDIKSYVLSMLSGTLQVIIIGNWVVFIEMGSHCLS